MEEDQFGIPDLRPYIAARPNFFPPPEILPAQSLPNPYDLMFRSDSTNAAAAGAGRWPRQETLTLLEIRSRLDPKFREANQKTALWDEVSRIMCDEYGYQRSGKKCREKFENLYKYYKKTKDGKAGRQDGRHYRFFRQLEALCGETSVSEPYHPQPQTSSFEEALVQPRFSDNSLSLCNYSESETTSSEEAKPGWKAKVKGFVDVQMKKLMEKQEAWMEEMAAAVERKERERAFREEEWRKQDAERVERERVFWAGERAWIEARDASLMEALRKITGKELVNFDRNKVEGFSTTGNEFWEDVGDKMSRLGSDRCSKKRKEETKNSGFFDQGSRNLDGGGGVLEAITRLRDDQSNGNDNNINESCLRYFMGDGYGRII